MSWAGNVVGGSKFTGSFNLAAGRTTLDLNWERTGLKANGTCNNNVIDSGSFTKVAAPYMADLASGPVQYLKLSATTARMGCRSPTRTRSRRTPARTRATTTSSRSGSRGRSRSCRRPTRRS